MSFSRSKSRTLLASTVVFVDGGEASGKDVSCSFLSKPVQAVSVKIVEISISRVKVFNRFLFVKERVVGSICVFNFTVNAKSLSSDMMT